VYCSPKRSGHHQVSITAHWTTALQELQGRLDGEIDTTGFASGCSF